MPRFLIHHPIPRPIISRSRPHERRNMKSVWPKSGERRVLKSGNGGLWTRNTQGKLFGNTSTHLIYDAFGNLTSGTNPLLFGYTGKAFDADTALQNNINRWYDATVGRWLSTDPIGFEGNDMNLYRYAMNRPFIYCDSDGLAWYDYTPIVATVINGMFPSPGQNIYDYMDDISLIPTKKDCCGNSGEIDYTCANKIKSKLMQFITALGVTHIPSTILDISFWGAIDLLAASPQMPYRSAFKSGSWILVIDGLINAGITIDKINNIIETSVRATEKFCRCP